MRRGGLGVLVVATLAVTFFVGPSLAPPASTTLQPSSQPGSEARAGSVLPEKPTKTMPLRAACKPGEGGPCDDCSELCPAQGLLNAIARYFGPNAEAQRGIRKYWGVPDDARPNTRFIVATVADPVHTHLSVFFDRQIDAIQEAVQSAGYLFARSYVPWDPKEHADDSDFRTRVAQQKYQEGIEAYPGLMIFRQAGNNPTAFSKRRHLFVFLVAETPTAGVNKTQFHQALCAIKAISRGEDCNAPLPRGTLSIMGPTFSGALYSLAFLLRDEVQGSFSNVVIHSGTASSQTTIGYFNSFLTDPENIRSLHIEFRTFQESYEYALDRMVRFACQQGYRAGEVAVVSEDETAYGSADWVSAAKHPGAEVQSSERRQSGQHPCANVNEVLHLYFPRNIAQLRSAYQHDLQAQNSSDSSKTRSRSSLQLDLTDTGTDDDSIPHFSRSTTPLSQEGIMLGLIANLQKHHAVYVVVTATNPLDMLFLVRYFRTAYSEGRVVTIDTDLLLPRELDDARLLGVMEITSYSLIPGAGDSVATLWPTGDPIHLDRVFPSNYNAGTFNALVALLALQDLPSPRATCAPVNPVATTPCADLPPAGYAVYGWPTLADTPSLANCPTPDGKALAANCPLVPPLWLTVLGHSGYWPVTLLDMVPHEDDPSAPVTELHAIQSRAHEGRTWHFTPRPWISLCWFFIVITLLYVGFIWYGSISSSNRSLVKFAPKPDAWRNFVLFVTHLMVLGTLLSLVWPWVRWKSHLQAHWLGVMLIVFALFVMCVFAADLSVRGSRAWALAFLAIALALCAVASVWRGPAGAQLNFTLHRYIHVTSGVSPLIPGLLLIFGGLWWCWYNLEGLALWEQKGFQFLPSRTDILPDQHAAAHDAARNVRLRALTIEDNRFLLQCMHSTGQFRGVIFWTLLTLVLIVSLIGIHHPIRSLEGSRYDVLYSFALLLAVFVLLCELYGVRIIWSELRRLLTALDRLPIRRAFQRMEVYAWKPLWDLGGSAVDDYVPIIAHQFEALSRLRNSNPDDSLRAAIAAADKRRDEFAIALRALTRRHDGHAQSERRRFEVRLRDSTAGTDAERTIQTVATIAGLQAVLASTCATALRYLNAAWDREANPVWRDQDEYGAKEDEQSRSELAPATRFAEDFVCLFYFNFISSVFMRMRTLVWTVAGIFVFALLSFSSYPFEPRASFHTVVTFLFLLVAVIIGWVFAQMHRDPTLSRITKTTPGELGGDFWLRFATFAAAPLLSLLASQFPGLSGSLFSWLQPALQALK